MTPEAEKKAKRMLYLMKHNFTFVVLDRESTSGQPDLRYGRITELSAVKIRNGQIIGTFDTLVDPEIKIPKKIVDLTHITNEMCEGKPKYQVAVRNFLQFCGNYPIVAHNAHTDVRYIDYFARQIGKKFDPNVIDTMTLARYIHRKDDTFKVFNLAYLAKCYHVSDEEHHRAMNDVIVTMKLFLKFFRILKRDVYNVGEEVEKEAGIKTFTNKETKIPNISEIEVRSFNLWKKNMKGTDYCRLYVKIYYNNEYDDIFYDFITKSWGIKGELKFCLPDNYGEGIMEILAKTKKKTLTECYDMETYQM